MAISLARRNELAREKGFISYKQQRYVSENPTSKAAQRLVREGHIRAPSGMPTKMRLDLKAQGEGWSSHGQKSMFWRTASQHLADEAKDDKGKILPEVREMLLDAIHKINKASYDRNKPILTKDEVSAITDLFIADGDANDGYPIFKAMYG